MKDWQLLLATPFMFIIGLALYAIIEAAMVFLIYIVLGILVLYGIVYLIGKIIN